VDIRDLEGYGYIRRFREILEYRRFGVRFVSLVLQGAGLLS